MRRYVVSVLLVAAVSSTGSGQTEGTPLLSALQAELTRSLEHLKSQPTPPYFLSYEVTETKNVSVSGSFGTLTSSDENRSRQLDIDLRVGDFNLDNTRRVRGGLPVFNDMYSRVAMPIEDDPDALRAIVWYHTDQKYKRAVEQFRTAKMNTAVKVETEDKAGDFSHAPAEKFDEPGSRYVVNRNEWENKVRKYTAPFQRYGNIYQASASMSANSETRWFVSSDGSRIQTSQTYYRLFINTFTKASDGMELPRYESYFSFTPEGLPDDSTVLKAIDMGLI